MCSAQKSRETRAANKALKEQKIEKMVEDAASLGISRYTARQLMQELAKRGYEGKLTYTKVETIDITNF